MPFICYTLLACLPFITIIVYITNLSVIFINHLGISLADYSYYQASTMGTFVIFSLSSVKLIAKKGIEFTQNLGLFLAVIGAIALFIVSLVDLTSVMFICISMGILAAGGSMMSGTFGMRAISIFPQMNGTALAACTAIRLFLIATFVFLTEIYFDGTILPVAIIITSYTVLTACFYGWLKLNQGDAA
jgi:DHA1 family bicyclomycin/chloramphenicol resistance-like MFS transporter